MRLSNLDSKGLAHCVDLIICSPFWRCFDFGQYNSVGSTKNEWMQVCGLLTFIFTAFLIQG